MEERFLSLFTGLHRAYGVAVPTGKKDARGKVSARYETRRAALDEGLWSHHLAGDHCLVPIPIRDDGTTGFGAIDVDVYPLDLKELTARVEEAKLPLVVCRSKSGGAHLFLFLTKPHDAEEVQAKLMSWAVALGYPGVEVFPKQISLASENDTGNGIAAPYRGGDGSLEYALSPKTGEALSVSEFLDLAEARRVDGGALPKVTVDVPDELADAPPCLQHWARIKVPLGTQNDVLFDFGVYAKKAFPDNWQEKLEDWNRRFLDPPGDAKRMLDMIKTLSKDKDYLYKAKCEGPHCNPQLCRRQNHGRGGGYDDPGFVIEGLTIIKCDPPIFIISVNGKRIELTGAQWRDQRLFGAQIEDALFMPYKPLKAKVWHEMRDRLYSTAEHEDAPEDAGERGQMLQQLDDFIAERQSDEREKLRHECCWFDEEHGRLYFRSRDFIQFLKRRRVYGAKEKDLYMAIRSIGGGSEQIRVGRSPLRVWWIPREPAPLPEPLPVSEIKTDDIPF